MNLSKLVESKRFWALVAGVAAVYFKDRLNLSPEQLQSLSIIVGGWILGDSYRGTK